MLLTEIILAAGAHPEAPAQMVAVPLAAQKDRALLVLEMAEMDKTAEL